MPASDAVKQDPGAPPARARVRRRGRPLALGCGGVLLGVALLWLARAPLLTALGRFLMVGEPPRRAEAIFVFGGDAGVRPFAAAALYRAGYAPRVLVPRVELQPLNRLGLLPGETELFLRILAREGVPPAAVEVISAGGESGSTGGDVRALRAWAARHRARRVLAVTSAWHTRRARLHLRRGLAGAGVEVTLYGAPSPALQADRWWKSETGLVTCFEEYVKLIRDTLRG